MELIGKHIMTLRISKTLALASSHSEFTLHSKERAPFVDHSKLQRHGVPDLTVCKDLVE